MHRLPSGWRSKWPLKSSPWRSDGRDHVRTSGTISRISASRWIREIGPNDGPSFPPGDADAETGRRGAFLEKASLRGADLRGAYLRVARLDGADLSGADLRDVEGLAQVQVDAGVCDRRTKLPEGFHSRAHDGG